MFTKKDLRNGDVCVLNNGDASIYVDLLGGVFICTTGYDVSRNWKENLTDVFGRVNDAFDIVKVYRPKEPYQCCFDDSLYSDGDLVFDRERDCKPILDKEEREYLSAVIKPFINNVSKITKVQISEHEYIRVSLNNLDVMLFPRFRIGTMYKNMKSDRPYTLKELCLQTATEEEL